MQLLEEGTILGIATAILVVGIIIFLLLFVPYLRDRISDLRPVSMLVALFFLLLGIIVVASWMIYFAQQSTWVLYPIILITLLFRIAAPYIMWGEMYRKHGQKKMWSRGISFFEFVSFVLAANAIYSAFSEESGGAISFWQDVIMFFAVLYNYSRMYLKLFMPFIKDSKLVLNWVAVFLMSVSFIILIPLFVPEFHVWYKVANAMGWLVGLWYLRRLDDRSQNEKKKGGRKVTE